MRTNRICLLAVLLLTTTFAFAERPEGPRLPPGLDGRFVELAGRVPGFGGYFFDENGDLNVFLTDLGQAPAARAALAQAVNERTERRSRPYTRAAEIIIRRAAFDFPTLQEWTTRLTNAITDERVHLTDTDEVRNAVFVGVADGKAIAGVQALAESLGIPRNALVVEVVEVPKTIATLNDYVRPLVGGLGITFNGSDCTLNANVWYTNIPQGIAAGTVGFLTASHCSGTWVGYDGATYSQGGTQIGSETFDPTTFTGGNCPAGRACRWADVLFGTYDSGISRSQGYVAQTTYYGTSSAGSLTISTSNPTWRYTGIVLPVTGNYLEKMGRTSGWTSGQVNSTCFNVLRVSPLPTFLCQDRVDAYAAAGDSGAPVFKWNSSTTAAYSGIVWSAGTGFYYMSNIDNIKSDLGTAVVVTP